MTAALTKSLTASRSSRWRNATQNWRGSSPSTSRNTTPLPAPSASPAATTQPWPTSPSASATPSSRSRRSRPYPEAVSDLRVAVIGYGLAGRFFHAPLIAATGGLELATVVTSNSERQGQIGREYPGAVVVGSAAELWALDHDLIVVATPNDAHAPLAGEAVARGIPVVVDKPLALSVAEAEGLVAAAERAGVLLTPFQNRRWDSDHLTLERLMQRGELGRVIRYESRFERWRPQPDTAAWREATAPERGGGQLLDLGSHLVDQALRLFGPPTHVYAEVMSHRGTAGDDDAFVALRHADEVISHLRMSAMTAAPGPRLRVLGTAAAFTVQRVDSQEAALRAGRPGRRPRMGCRARSSLGSTRARRAERARPQ